MVGLGEVLLVGLLLSPMRLVGMGMLADRRFALQIGLPWLKRPLPVHLHRLAALWRRRCRPRAPRAHPQDAHIGRTCR